MYAGDGERKRICIVVLGDFGRSPRMQYHALSLAKNRFVVDVICCGGSTPHEDIITNPNIKQHLLMEPPKFAKWIPRPLMYFMKVMWQFIVMLNMLLSITKPSYILAQNPPSVPTLPVIWLYCYFFKVKWIIDWHNYGYTILALSNRKSILVKLYQWCEQYFGKKAACNFCVTEAMKKDLLEKWNIKATVLYDRPPKIFHPTTLEEKHNLFVKLEDLYPVLRPKENSTDGCEETRFTSVVKGTIVEKIHRPVLLVSGTSWTEDEDFNILLDALSEYENEVSNKNLPDIVCAITGKGPLQSQFLELIAEKQFDHVIFITPWLSAEDYPKLIGSADLGVCLHTSSSGLDLPMKVVDMFGCELPVCAVDYKCLGELVKHGENGLLFHDSKQLAQQLQDLLQNFPDHCTQLQTFQKKLKCYRDTRWDETWERAALPVFRH